VLHPTHLDDHFPHVHAAGEATALRLSRDFREHARHAGLPADLVSHLRVRYDEVSGELRPGTDHPDYHEQLLDWEHGTLERPPTGVMQTFDSSHAQKASDYFSNALVGQMGL
jgi:hypothetical protein